MMPMKSKLQGRTKLVQWKERLTDRKHAQSRPAEEGGSRHLKSAAKKENQKEPREKISRREVYLTQIMNLTQAVNIHYWVDHAMNYLGQKFIIWVKINCLDMSLNPIQYGVLWTAFARGFSAQRSKEIKESTLWFYLNLCYVFHDFAMSSNP